jgi:hypothetical protein
MCPKSTFAYVGSRSQMPSLEKIEKKIHFLLAAIG